VTYELELREIERDDLEAFLEHEQDPIASEMAAFTVKDARDKEAFLDRWDRIFADGNIVGRTILVDREVAGSILLHNWFGDPEVTLWVDREHWGRGVATSALSRFLELVEMRPLYARTAFDNHGSRRVLEKCGFKVTGRNTGYAPARGEEVEELLLTLD
jgi:RimJ/RimL family protein N-acetyltransferase